ncbi:unnamed protein product [Peniophora sp. CBMAI 1063]|nr:unnamed protein product [Peniophora sp. CBMAI 1063]
MSDPVTLTTPNLPAGPTPPLPPTPQATADNDGVLALFLLTRFHAALNEVLRDRWMSRAEVVSEVQERLARYGIPASESIQWFNHPSIQTTLDERDELNEALYERDMAVLARDVEFAIRDAITAKRDQTVEEYREKTRQLLDTYRIACEDGSLEHWSEDERTKFEAIVAEALEILGDAA